MGVADMRRKTAHIVGLLSVGISLILWFITTGRGSNSAIDYSFPFLFLLSVVLPIVAAWKSSKMWLLMLLSPIVLYVFVLFHIC
jgi:steroid 5-alpha reductase family enzyme